jgi:hypothetical protein
MEYVVLICVDAVSAWSRKEKMRLMLTICGYFHANKPATTDRVGKMILCF